MARFITHSPAETAALGQKLAAGLRGGEVIVFTGGLGAGKTTFCGGLADGLDAIDPVSSPTFAIVNYYRGRIPLAHFDAYRISRPEDLETAGFYDYVDQGAVAAVEWSENIAGLLEEPLIRVEFLAQANNRREILIEGADWL